ncbi:hypothetical protein DID88_001126 [Monilinia fructigena]|uniref:Signal peptidase complex catalytic subunit SEC11 n=1 Tax=Monilinia fructigena TaxID=38457 RepID=A0A395IYX7_9HELO|nr:hypothetical protein DID88_001126 [Monilinia fructigena]
MEPAFQRGDLLFLWNRNLLEETKVGEIVVYNVKGKDIPIVHRLVRKFGAGPKAKLLTKGDNNVADDTELYARGQDYIEREDIIGSKSSVQYPNKFRNSNFFLYIKYLLRLQS